MKGSKTNTLQGEVVKKSSANSISVKIEKRHRHPLYRKVIKSHRKYLVHCTNEQQDTVKVGDIVVIAEGRKVSKTKSWHLQSIITVEAKSK